MSDSHTQLALREWRAQIAQPVTLAALIGTGAVLGVMGPFDTDDHLGLLERLTYWIFATAVGYGIGSLVGHLMAPHLERFHMLLRASVMAPITGGLITLVIVGLNFIVFDLRPTAVGFVSLGGTTIVISWIVTAVLSYSDAQRPAPQIIPADPPAPSGPNILERLPLELRAPLVALSVEDHYVRVQTVKGSEMILLRLSDAMREVGDTAGAQVHRSHWVAFDQVVSTRREKDRAFLTLSTGAVIPVSRANLPKIKDAGLLPK